MTQDNGGGREWRPYEIATPIVREGAPTLPPPPPPGADRSPYAAPRAYIADRGVDHGHDEIVLADPVTRLLARLIDLGLTMVPVLLIVFAGYRQYSREHFGLEGMSTGAMTAIGIALLMFLGLAIWNIVLMAQEAQTVGKHYMKIRIARTDGSQAGFARIFFRRSLAVGFLSRLASLLHPLLGLLVSIGDVLLIFREDRRCLHDQIADTIVVEVRP